MSASSCSSASASSCSPIRHVLITGTSRGLGLEFVRQYVLDPNTHVIATARNLSKAAALQQLKQKHSNLTLVELDVNSSDSIRSALSSLPPISVLINNAAVTPGLQSVAESTVAQLTETFHTNVVGVLVTLQAALPALQQARAQYGINPLVVNISTAIGSMTLTNKRTYFDGKGSVPYRISKAALNMLTAAAAQEFTDVTFISVSPGWVDTDMGNGGGKFAPPLSPAESVSGMRTVIAGVKHEQSGALLSYDGTTLEF